MLAVLAEVAAVGVDHGGGVVVDPGLVLLVDGDDQDEAELAGEFAHPPHGGAVGDGLGPAVVLRVLHLAEVRGVEDLLEAEDLRALRGRLAGVALVEGDHALLVAGPAGLDEGGADDLRHGYLRNSAARPGAGPRSEGRRAGAACGGCLRA